MTAPLGSHRSMRSFSAWHRAFASQDRTARLSPLYALFLRSALSLARSKPFNTLDVNRFRICFYTSTTLLFTRFLNISFLGFSFLIYILSFLSLICSCQCANLPRDDSRKPVLFGDSLYILPQTAHKSQPIYTNFSNIFYNLLYFSPQRLTNRVNLRYNRVEISKRRQTAYENRIFGNRGGGRDTRSIL